jgi:hypothetical protein
MGGHDWAVHNNNAEGEPERNPTAASENGCPTVNRPPHPTRPPNGSRCSCLSVSHAPMPPACLGASAGQRIEFKSARNDSGTAAAQRAVGEGNATERKGKGDQSRWRRCAVCRLLA